MPMLLLPKPLCARRPTCPVSAPQGAAGRQQLPWCWCNMHAAAIPAVPRKSVAHTCQQQASDALGVQEQIIKHTICNGSWRTRVTLAIHPKGMPGAVASMLLPLLPTRLHARCPTTCLVSALKAAAFRQQVVQPESYSTTRSAVHLQHVHTQPTQRYNQDKVA